mmetsp:Transcript_26226/g.49214  ORF Transcript_26226/g.49214 Transcript_26226/m.49214 type:complete len:506 (+) Transcript_26226:71-1588(+)
MLLPGVKKHSDYANEYSATLKQLHRMHQILTVFYIPLVVTCMAFSCYFAYIHGAVSSYTDPGEDWEACLVVNNAMQVPLAPIMAEIGDKVTTTLGCTVNGIGEPTCSTNCSDAIVNTCILPLVADGPVIPDVPAIPLPVGEVLESLSYVGFQTVIFSMVSHGALNRALRHPSWLPATISLLVWCCFAMLTYYTINPFLPVPAKTNATLLIFTDYFRKSVFDAIPASDGTTGHCDRALKVSWTYLAVILAIVLNIALTLVVAIKAEIARHISPYKKVIQPLERTVPPVICCSMAVVFYVIVVCTKIQTSFVALDAIRGYDTTQEEAHEEGRRLWFSDAFFPFQKGTLDITTILFVSTFMSTIRGYTRQSVSAFRLAAGTAFAFAVTSYPGYVGAYRFYDYNNFKSDTDCKNFFLTEQNAPLFGYPSSDQAEIYCQSFKWSLGAATGVLIVMHAMIFLAARTYADNMHRASAIFEPLDPQFLSSEVPPKEDSDIDRASFEVKSSDAF